MNNIIQKTTNGIFSIGLFAIAIQIMTIFNVALFKIIVKMIGA